MPAAPGPCDGGVPEGNNSLSWHGVHDGIGQVDALRLVVGDHLGVGISQQLHALDCAVVPYTVRKGKAILQATSAIIHAFQVTGLPENHIF